MTDWLDWEKRLKELANDTSEGEWPDPNLQKIEDTLLHDASTSSGLWIRAVWTIIKDVLNKPTPKTWDFLKDATDEPPIDVTQTVNRIVHVINIADKRVEHVNKLPEKGPWIDVPKPPEGPRTVKVPQPHKTAEWLARQSAASKMREWSDGMREDVRWQVVQAIREGISAGELATRLEKRWDNYGQHFQMIAVTEMSIAYNDAVLTHLSGKHVVVPVIGDDKVCDDCKKLLEGKVFYVNPTPIEDPTKQQREQYLWPGKSNIGRKRADWMPCLPLHPRCRHVAVKYRGGNPYDYLAPKRGNDD